MANFLCDNVTYLLGCDTKGNAKRAAQAFQACGELHRRILDGVKDRAASAVCAFFSKAPQWQIAQRLMGDEAWKSFENQKRFDKTNKNNNEQGENND